MKHAAPVVIGLVLTLATPALATHNHPAKAKQAKLSFVTAYNTCASPNTTHKPAIALPGCAPPVPSTNNNATNEMTFGANGSLTAQVKVGAADITIVVKGSDILNNGGSFSGTLTAVATIRATDHGCTAPGFTTPCTIFDFPFPVSVTCTNGKCKGKTSANTVVPAAVATGDEENIEIGQFSFNDPDGDPAFRQGLFLP